MFMLDIILKNTPTSLSIQRKTSEDAEAIYQQILTAVRNKTGEVLELTCERQPDKKIGVLSSEILAVQLSEKAGTATASGKPPGFAFIGE